MLASRCEYWQKCIPLGAAWLCHRCGEAHLGSKHPRLCNHGAFGNAVSISTSMNKVKTHTHLVDLKITTQTHVQRRRPTYLWSIAHTEAPLSAPMRIIISCKRLLQPTPSTINTVSVPESMCKFYFNWYFHATNQATWRTFVWHVWAMARSVVSTSMANTVSCRE